QAKAMILCHRMLPDARIGPAPNIATIYPASSKPEDILAADTYAAIRNWLYLDVAVHGHYNATAWAYLEERGYTPIMEGDDMDILQQGKPDFIAFNYYTSQTVGESTGGEAIIHTPVTNTKPSENLEHIEDLLTGIFERLNSAGKLTLLVFVLYYERFTPV